MLHNSLMILHISFLCYISCSARNTKTYKTLYSIVLKVKQRIIHKKGAFYGLKNKRKRFFLFYDQIALSLYSN